MTARIVLINIKICVNLISSLFSLSFMFVYWWVYQVFFYLDWLVVALEQSTEQSLVISEETGRLSNS